MPFYIQPKRIAARWVDPFASRDETLRKQFLSLIWMGQIISPETLRLKPDPYYVYTSTKKLDLPAIWGGGQMPWHVDSSVKDILEELEPGRHTFIPVNVHKSESNDPERKFFILHVTTAINAVVIEETRFADGIGQFNPAGVQISPRGPIVLFAQKILGHHFWRCGIAKWGGET